VSPTTAIQRAEQWRKEGACGEAAKVAIALLNELERVQINVAAYRNFTAEMIAAGIEEQQKNK
jgi:FAD/FMN-containing dehydrogenase